jgi:REP-associated tyrosine transposase
VRTTPQQAELNFPEPRTHGGRRKGAGRPKRKTGVPHASRERVTKHDPRLVTIKLVEGLPWLREALEGRALMHCIRAAQRADFRIVHYSIQSDHVHLIVEADDKRALSRGMKGCNARIALTLNSLWRRRGKVFRERFHDVALKTLRQVHNALKYVLNNHFKHGVQSNAYAAPHDPDVFSSARYFDGWRGRAPDLLPGADGAVVVRGGWKLSCGWKRHYRPIAIDAVPGVGLCG